MTATRAALALSCLALAACRREPPPAPEPLVLAVAQIPYAALAHVAIGKGHLEANGLAPTIQRHAFGKLALEALLAGKADVATVAETPVVLAALRGEPLALLATISSASGNTMLVARRDAGIAGGRDLAGKRVGVPRGTSAEFFLDTLLVRHGLEATAVSLVDLKPAAMEEALARREVDAVAVWNPVLRQLRDRFGEAVLLLDAKDVYSETFNVVARPALVRERPAAVDGLLRALLEADGFARAEPAEAQRLVAAQIGQADVVGMMELFDYRVSLDQSLLVLLEEEAGWALREKLVPGARPPNFLKVVDPEPLLRVRPAAVHLIR